MWRSRTRRVGAFLDDGSEIEGRYTCTGTVVLDAKLRGEITARDTLIVGEHAVVEATVHAATLVVHGKLVGNVTATERVELKRTARVTGDVEVPVVEMEAGSVLDGRCRMTKDEPAEPPLSLVVMKKGWALKAPIGVVLVHGDGARVTRLTIPRWIARAALGLQAALVAAALGLWGAHGLVREQIDALRQRAEDERRVAETFQSRLAAVREELAAWRILHAKIWKAFGPDADGAPADTVDEDGPRLRDLKRVVNRTSRLLSALPLGWPIRGPVNSAFGLRRSPWTGRPEHHHGIDIGSPPGTPIHSPVAGTVVATGSHGRLGKHVAVDHGNGVRSLYGHLEALDVKNGERVERGQVLGLVGNTGRSTGPHLHYELLVDGMPVDPRAFLSAR